MPAAGFCSLCNIEIASFEGLTACPNCGTKGQPCAYADDVTVALNRHELHVLCAWAERWGMFLAQAKEGGPGIVYAIVQRLRQRYPALANVPLTLVDEAQALRDAGYVFRTNIPGIEHGPEGA